MHENEPQVILLYTEPYKDFFVVQMTHVFLNNFFCVACIIFEWPFLTYRNFPAKSFILVLKWLPVRGLLT
jgi:hypothetical protein